MTSVNDVTAMTSLFRVLVATDKHRNVGMVQDAVTDATQEGTAKFALTPAANHDKPRPHLLRVLDDLVPSLVSVGMGELGILDLDEEKGIDERNEERMDV